MQLKSLISQLGKIEPAMWIDLNQNYAARARIAQECDVLVQNSNGPNGSEARNAIHDILIAIYQRDFSQPKITDTEVETQPVLRDIASIFERSMLHDEIALVRDEVSGYPTNGREFINWLKQKISNHSASRHAYYHEYLPDYGTYSDLQFLLAQETSLDPRFDDILALIQVGTHGDEKMEIARNYWDEMGNGEQKNVHSALFGQTLSEIGVNERYIDDNIQFEAKLCGNLSAALALSRRHYYKAIGYFGVTEYLAPRRFKSLIQAWRRLGLPSAGIHYHEIHIEIDARHAIGWFKNVIEPCVDKNPIIGRDIAIGTMIRLNTSTRYLDALLARTDSLVTS